MQAVAGPQGQLQVAPQVQDPAAENRELLPEFKNSGATTAKTAAE